MIRDDTRHSSLSDVRLDCRYCSLSFIFRGLATVGVYAATVKYVHVHTRAPLERNAARDPRWNSSLRRTPEKLYETL